MSWIDRVQQASVRLTRAVALVAVGAVLIGAVLTVIDVGLRSSIRKSLFGTNDIVLLILVVAVSACFAHGVAMREHMRVSALGRALGGRIGHWLCEIFAGLVTLVCFVGFAWQFGKKAGALAASHERTLLLEWSVAPWWWVASGLLGLAALAQLIVVFTDIESLVRGREPVAEEAPAP